MEDLNQQKKIINLGKLLVKELGVENESDTLSRWMAHYLADRITQIEALPLGDETEGIKKDCFETILKLWKHRWEMSPIHRPLENFEPILRVLNDIAPENKSPFFYRSHSLLPQIDKNSSVDAIEKYTNAIIRIDRIARIWIEFMLNEATKVAKAISSDDLIQTLKDMEEGQDIEAIKIILEDIDSFQEKEIKERIEELEKYSKLTN